MGDVYSYQRPYPLPLLSVGISAPQFRCSRAFCAGRLDNLSLIYTFSTKAFLRLFPLFLAWCVLPSSDET